MKLRDLGIETISALDANRGRSALTVLGIVIGISAVIAMTALIGGIRQALVGELGLSQAQLVNIGVYVGVPLTYDDVDSFARDLASDYEYMVGLSYGNAMVTTGKKTLNASIEGSKPAYFKAMGSTFLQGRPYSEAEEAKGAMVVVLNQAGATKLFGADGDDAVGKTVSIDYNDYTVVGVIEGGDMAANSDYIDVYMPFRTSATRITGTQEIGTINGFAHEGSDMDAVVERTKQYIYRKFNLTTQQEQEENVYVFSMKSMIDSVNATMGAFAMLMTVVASVSLLVGGIGIMNMMLTNVTERIREIGLRKALGARRSDITKQFMLESVCLCLAGGLLGVLLGYAGSFALAGLGAEAILGENMSVTPVIDLGTVLMATAICVGIGVLFGWYPARRAARLDPVESLHYQ